MSLRHARTLTTRLRPSLNLPKPLINTSRLPPALTPHLPHPFPTQQTRLYATPTDIPIPRTIPPELLSKLKQHPAILEQMQVVVELFKRKGVATDRTPTTMEMMRLASDKEVIGEVQKLHGLFQEAGMLSEIAGVLKGLGLCG